jgi:hypothetical protein
MSDQQKKDLLDKGKRLVNDSVGQIKQRFGGQSAPDNSMSPVI